VSPSSAGTPRRRRPRSWRAGRRRPPSGSARSGPRDDGPGRGVAEIAAASCAPAALGAPAGAPCAAACCGATARVSCRAPRRLARVHWGQAIADAPYVLDQPSAAGVGELVAQPPRVYGHGSIPRRTQRGACTGISPPLSVRGAPRARGRRRPRRSRARIRKRLRRKAIGDGSRTRSGSASPQRVGQPDCEAQGPSSPPALVVGQYTSRRRSMDSFGQPESAVPLWPSDWQR
jgi:hypothetical protein